MGNVFKQLLQGKPLGHPLHPILVHFPIALLYLSFGLDLLSLLCDDSSPFVRSAFYTMFFALIAALVAAAPGFVDFLDIRADHPAKKVAIWHMALNLAVVIVYAVNLFMRRGDLDRPRAQNMPLVLSAIGVVLLSVSGYLGGVMVYDDGIAVGRHRRRGKTPDRTIRLSSADATDGRVLVPGGIELQDDQTLRVDLDGTVLALARVNGEYFAFQEFCTHRFGPLSEGRFANGQVMCPWHRSCFDLRTGKVAASPAKVDLKTFETITADGQVYLRLPSR